MRRHLKINERIQDGIITLYKTDDRRNKETLKEVYPEGDI